VVAEKGGLKELVANGPSDGYFQHVMFENRSCWRPTRGGLSRSATVWLVVALVIAFVLQSKLLNPEFADQYLALSLPGLQHGFVWQLLTYQFMHGGWFHLLVNGWAIFLFGREIERLLGKTRMLALYFSAGVVGGLLQMLCAWFWPDRFGGAVVGASAGGFGLVAAFAAFYPQRGLLMLLFFVLPLKMRARTLLLFCLVLTGLGIAFPDSILGGNIAHAAHLGGMLTGYFSALWLFGRARNRTDAIVIQTQSV
jgi:rhomboid family protein